MKDYEKIFDELGFDYDNTFPGCEQYVNWQKKIVISFIPENGEIFDIEHVSVEASYFDNFDLWSLLNTISTIESELLKRGFVFGKDYIFALPNEREQKREMSDRNRKEREI